MKSLNEYSKTELLTLKKRHWNEVSVYDSLVIIPSNQKHESGYALMNVVGVNSGEPIELAISSADDISWEILNPNLLRTDCLLKSKGLHFWGLCKFNIGADLSSISIKVTPFEY